MSNSSITGVAEIQAKLRSLTKGAKSVKLQVGYTAPYALTVHEDLEANHPRGGQAKYLEEPVKLLRKSMQNFIRDKLREGMKLDEVLVLAGNMLLKVSQGLVPVDTGALRDSGFVELEKD